jgi:carboxyl-terminal processing protease
MHRRFVHLTMARRAIMTAAVAALTTIPATAQHAPRQTIDAATRAYVAGRLYAAVQLYFAHWDDVPSLDLDAAFRAYLDEAMAAPDRKGFSLASLAFMARFGNSHTGFRDAELLEGTGGVHGFSVRYLAGEWVVAASDRSDLAAGDVIAAVDGVPIETFYADHARYIPSSTERFRRRRLFGRWYRFVFPLQYELALRDGRRVQVDRRNTPEWPSLKTEGRWLVEDRIGYIRVPSWDAPRFEQRAMELLEEMRDADALVVDVRGNQGGSSPIAFVKALMERPWRWWAESTPMRMALFSYYAERGRSGFGDFARAHMAWPAEVQAPDSTFMGALVLLVDEGCHSACEDFVMPFKDNGRAVLVGDSTAGSTGQPYVTTLGDGMGVAVGAKREYFPDGRRFEGVGVSPDYQRVPTAADLRAGRDVELEAALEILRQR